METSPATQLLRSGGPDADPMPPAAPQPRSLYPTSVQLVQVEEDAVRLNKWVQWGM
jgi:hypothetical protein